MTKSHQVLKTYELIFTFYSIAEQDTVECNITGLSLDQVHNAHNTILKHNNFTVNKINEFWMVNSIKVNSKYVTYPKVITIPVI